MTSVRREADGNQAELSPRPSVVQRLQDCVAPSRERDGALLWVTNLLEAAAGVALFVMVVPDLSGPWHLLLFLLALNLIAERHPISIYGDSNVTTAFVFTMAIIVTFGAPGAALVAPLEVAVRRFGNRPLWDIRYFRNAGQSVIAYVFAAWSYQLFAPVNPAEPSWQMVIAAPVASMVAFGLTAVQVTLSVALRTRQRYAAVWENHRWLAPYYIAFGIVGLAIAGAYSGLGYWGIFSFLVPAFVLRYSMKQYVDKTAENVEKLRQQNSALEVANVEIRKVSDELRVTYSATLEALVNALEARDQETKGHSIRVAHYMLNIAEALGVKRGTQEWTDMQHGALLHDVGKIGVRDSILLKPGKLTPEEWEFMRMHPEIGYNILREVKFLHGAAEIVLAHHERWDGQGYPHGLKRDEIPLGSRIFSVVDTFDSMTSDRPYRAALDPHEALEEILRCSGTQFDPLVVEAFLDIFEAWVIERERLHGQAVVLRPAA